MAVSALYIGRVFHQRVRPRRHRLDYAMFQMLVDLDELDAIAGTLRLFARNRFAPFAFHDRDYGDRSGRPLRAQIEGHLADAGIDIAGGPLRLLTMPRMFGHVFNPISVWFCHHRDGPLAAIIYEVTNTFHERHSYLIPVEAGDGPVRQSCEKRLYVSPFMDMEMAYRFAIEPPGDAVKVTVMGDDADGPMITAVFAGERRPLTDRSLARAFLTHPLLTLKVVAGIHWEALKLVLKGIGVRKHPPAPHFALTIVR